MALLAGGSALHAWPGAAARQVGPSPAPVVATTRHHGTFHGQAVDYVATVAETLVSATAGPPTAMLVTTSYVRQGVADPSRRPVIFAFNGGPGASSTPLHLSALGPRRYALDASGERTLIDNPVSPLDVADLVFVDPVGTGFSRPFPDADGQPFWSVTGDAASVAMAIDTWLREHQRQSSPKFLFGESYGTTRAAQIVSARPALRFDGVLLLSMTGGPTDPDEALSMLVPSFAVTAAFHGVVDARGRTPQQIFDDASVFARGDYLAALKRGDALPADVRAQVAEELASRIGLPATLISERRLRVDLETFMVSLLAARGLRTGQLDARVTGPLKEFAGKTPPYDDPSMPGARPFRRPTAHLYFTEDLQFPARGAQYVPLNLDVNATWVFDRDQAFQDPLALVAGAMKANPRLRLFWIAGLYDLTTPLASGRYAFARAGVPDDRVTVLAVPTGHMPYEGDDALARFTAAVQRFVTGRP